MYVYIPEPRSNRKSWLFQTRKWKYDESIIQHWVETSWSGQLVHKDNEKSIHEKEEEAQEMPNPSLTFENGGNQTNPGSASVEGISGDVTWPTNIYICVLEW